MGYGAAGTDHSGRAGRRSVLTASPTKLTCPPNQAAALRNAYGQYLKAGRKNGRACLPTRSAPAPAAGTRRDENRKIATPQGNEDRLLCNAAGSQVRNQTLFVRLEDWQVFAISYSVASPGPGATFDPDALGISHLEELLGRSRLDVRGASQRFAPSVMLGTRGSGAFAWTRPPFLSATEAVVCPLPGRAPSGNGQRYARVSPPVGGQVPR